MMKATKHTPLLLAAGLLALGSCGSTPEPQAPPPAELAASAPEIVEEQLPPAEVQVLEDQLAQMRDAMEQAALEPEVAAEPEPELSDVESAAEEVASLYLDPNEIFPVEIIDGVPVQIAMIIEEPEPVPEPEVELASQEPLDVSSAEPVVALEPQAALEEGAIDATDEVEVTSLEEPEIEAFEGPVELSAAELFAMNEAMAPEMLADPGYMAPDPSVDQEVAVASEEIHDEGEHGSVDLTAEDVQSTLADSLALALDGPEAAQPMGPAAGDLLAEHGADGHDSGAHGEALEMDPEAMQAAIARSIAMAFEGPHSEADSHEEADGHGEGGHDPEGHGVEGELTAEGMQAAIADSIAKALAGTDAEEVSAELQVDVLPVAEQPEPMQAIAWQVAIDTEVSAPVVAQFETNEQPLAAGGALEELPDGEANGAELAAARVEIEAVEQTATSTALDVQSASALEQVFAFTKTLDPSTRLLLGPLCLVDPSGNLARASVGFMEFAGVATKLSVGPPGDPALVGLTRSSGAEFNPVSIEQAELTEEPGLGMIWWGQEIPEKQVASSVEVQTPTVGRVRLVLNSGDYVEGILHSVGQNQYWVDGDLGRFAVRAGLVAHIEHLPKPGLGQQIQGLQAGDLVRAKAKNGYIEGRLISMKDGDALIETASGMRITLPDAEVEPLGDSKTRVVVD